MIEQFFPGKVFVKVPTQRENYTWALYDFISPRQMVAKLRKFIRQKPGIDPRNYGDGMDGWRAYRNESNRVSRQRKGALQELWFFKNRIGWSGLDYQLLVEATRGSRIEFQADWSIYYCTGQYFPVEFRPAMERLLHYYGQLEYQKQIGG